MNIVLSFWSLISYSLMVSFVSSATTYKGDCETIQNIIKESKCSLEKCFNGCVVNSEGKVTSLDLNDYRLTDDEIKKILAFDTITTLNYVAYCPVQSTCIRKDEEFPSALSNLVNLKELDFTYNRLYEKRKTHTRYYTTIGSNIINNLKSLKKLSLSHLKISEENANEIVSLRNVNEINLNDCPMNGLSYAFLKNIKKLKKLHVSNTKESVDIIENLNGMKKLKDLSLNLANFTQEDIGKIGKLVNLESLDLKTHDYTTELDFNPLKKLKDLSQLSFINSDYKNLINLNLPLNTFKYLETLNFEYVNISQDNINGISKLKNIENLSFDSCNLSVDFSPIKKLKTLVNLEISSCDDDLNDYETILTTICSLKSLEKLRLYYVNKPIPSGFANLRNLEYLDLDFNHIETMPDIFGRLTNLQYLNLNSNSITELPNSIKKLENLEKFEMYGNKLKKIPDTIGKLTNLKYLDFNDNEIENMPKSLGNLKKLEHLNLKKNKIIDEIPESLNSLKHLKYIDLTENPDIKGKSLTNPSLEYCEFVEKESYNYSICMAKQLPCMDQDYDYAEIGFKLCE